MSNNSKIQNKMPLCLMAKQGILWHKSNVIVLLALSHRINMSQLVLFLPETEHAVSLAACQNTMLSIIWAVCLKLLARDSIVIDYWNNKHYSGILFIVYILLRLLSFGYCIWGMALALGQNNHHLGSLSRYWARSIHSISAMISSIYFFYQLKLKSRQLFSQKQNN